MLYVAISPMNEYISSKQSANISEYPKIPEFQDDHHNFLHKFYVQTIVCPNISPGQKYSQYSSVSELVGNSSQIFI